ncbi:MAG: radical SAM protein [Spirochaetales bacterium]|nr:radical SAM protein [Spirochaetales bacterium]
MKTIHATQVLASVLTPLINNRLIPYPYIMIFVLTRKCNCRCKMCGIWKTESHPMSLSVIKTLFERNDFSFIKSLTLTGGEPFLRPDLTEIAKICFSKMPFLEHVLVATNGLLENKIINDVKEICMYIASERNHIHSFDVQVSLDGVGEIHDHIRGVPGAYIRVTRSLSALLELSKEYPFLNIRMSTMVLPANLSCLEELHQFAEREKILIHYSPVVLSPDYYNNEHCADSLLFYNQQMKEEAARFFRKRGLENSGFRTFYRDMISMLFGDVRRRVCMFGFYGCVVEENGDLYPCLNCEKVKMGNLIHSSFEEIWFHRHSQHVRRNLRKECCPDCTSLCYTHPANFLELLEEIMRRKYTWEN